MKPVALAFAPLCLVLTASLAVAQPADQPLDTSPESLPQVTPPPAPAVVPEAAPTAPVAPATPVATAAPSTAEDSDADVELSQQRGEREPQKVNKRLFHGFRVGYNFVMNSKRLEDGTLDVGPGSDRIKLKSPHSFVLGYEGFYRLIGHSWLNVLLVGNVSVAGLEQNKFIPSSNGLIGFEMNESFQLGVGINVTPVKESLTHLIAAAGWTPKVGGFYVPLHFYFIPDKDGFHRTGATIGVNW